MRILLFFIASIYTSLAFGRDTPEEKAENARHVRELVTNLNLLILDHAQLVFDRASLSEDDVNEIPERREELIDDIRANFLHLQPKIDPQQAAALDQDLTSLQEEADNDNADQQILQKSEFLLKKAIEALRIIHTPATTPDAVKGKELFVANCSSCHGPVGAGDGPLAGRLQPPPPDLTSSLFASHGSPFQTFSFLLSGIPDSAMSSFIDVLSPEDLWNVSFYVSSLPFGQAPAGLLEAQERWHQVDPELRSQLLSANLSLKTLSSLNGHQLSEWLESILGQPQEGLLSLMRTVVPFLKEIPRGVVDHADLDNTDANYGFYLNPYGVAMAIFFLAGLIIVGILRRKKAKQSHLG